jgi:endonuclease III
MTPKKRIQLLAILEELYPNANSELDFKNEYQLLIAVMLSAQCTDVKVNQVTPALFSKYPDFKSLGKARLPTVEKLIGAINYYKTKSKNIIATSKLLATEYDSIVPKDMDTLITLPGVGRKTANVVLGETGAAPAIPVDTHVFRVSRRLGLSKGTTTDKVEEDLMKLFPPETWRGLHHRLIFHGRRVCNARSPKCTECALQPICPSSSC